MGKGDTQEQCIDYARSHPQARNAELAERFGVAAKTIGRWLKAAGVKRTRGRPKTGKATANAVTEVIRRPVLTIDLEELEPAAYFVPVSRLVPWDDNPRENDETVAKVAASIKRFGFGAPVVARLADQEIIAGHTRLKAAHLLGLDAVRFLDLDPVDAHLYALADNKIPEGSQWSSNLSEVLKGFEEGVDLTGLGWTDEELQEILADSGDGSGGGDGGDGGGDGLGTGYTTKVKSPVYTPKGDKPEVAALCDGSKAAELLTAIDASEAPEPVKAFLRLAAARHNVFNYEQVAEYYAHAPAEVQALMEDSALVIIDFDKAIELGFVKLTEELAEAYSNDSA